MLLKNRKRLVILITAFSFLMILIFNYCTPMLSDDFDYMSQARSANSFFNLVRQEYHQYMTWNGRSVTFLLFRIFLYLPQIILKIANSLVFLLLTILLYLNVEKNSRWEPFVMLLVQLGMWIFAVAFPQTVLWECGAFVYLWGMTIILGCMTVVRFYVRGERKASALNTILLFLFGWAAGWCNENTSGGALLFFLILIVVLWKQQKKIPAYLISATVGTLVGIGFLVLGPGVRIRGSFKHDLHPGLYGMVSRVQKLVLFNKEALLVLLIVFAVTVVWTLLKEVQKLSGDALSIPALLWKMRYRLLFFVLFVATHYALAATTTPQIRAIFGPGVFLILACVQGLTDNLETDGESLGLRFVYFSTAAALSIWLFLELFDAGAMMMRIRRDYNERISYIEELIAAGATEISVALFHEDFNIRYTCAFDMELTEDPTFWTNVQYEQFFGVESITAIPYDDWAHLVGKPIEEE